MLSRRDIWHGIGACAIAAIATATFSAGTRAQANYPDRPVRIILPYGPGGVADVSTRLVAAKLSERMGQNFFIDNRPGAGGIVGAKAALSLPADGYTMYLAGNGAAISESLFASLPFDITRDFSSVSLLAQFDMLLATKMDTRFDTVQKLVAYGKQNPGKLNFGSIAVGSTQNLSAELFKMVTGVDAAVVTFRTTPELMTAIERGDVDVGFDYYAAFSPMVAGKQIKIIATSGDKPSPLFTGVPTVKDFWLSRLCRHQLERAVGPRRHAGRHHRQAQRRDRHGFANARDRRKNGQSRHGAAGEHARGADAAPESRRREMARGHRQSRHPETVIGR